MISPLNEFEKAAARSARNCGRRNYCTIFVHDPHRSSISTNRTGNSFRICRGAVPLSRHTRMHRRRLQTDDGRPRFLAKNCRRFDRPVEGGRDDL